MVIDNAYLNEDEAEYELHGQVPPLRDEFHLRDVGELALALAVGLAGLVVGDNPLHALLLIPKNEWLITDRYRKYSCLHLSYE